jgi:uncharacterized membrane protein YcaP (DUF421 family)
MFIPSVGIGELVLRAAIVYAAVFILLRIVGKKHVGELAPFDLVVLLLLSETVQNALIPDDKSLTAGIIAAATLFGLNQVLGYLTWRAKPIERMLEGTPRFLIRHGHVLRDELAREQITQSELMEALRREGCFSIGRVRYAILENDGGISVSLRAKGEDKRDP